MARTRLYRDGALVADGFPPAEISDHLAEESSVVWLDLCRPTPQELELLADEFGLHRLAIEDATARRQRPKLDHYGTHKFLAAHAAHLDTHTGELTISQVSVFVTRQALITVRSDEGFEIDKVVARWDDSDVSLAHVGGLLHAVIDYAVDTQFAVIEALDDQLEGLEDALFADQPHPTAVQRRSFELRKSLVILRRVSLPLRDVVNALVRPDLHVVDADSAPYFRDVQDNVLRVAEWTDSLRDVLSTVLETSLTVQGNRMNMTMKQVTSWAAVIAVPTAITGFYGQNVPYPGYGHWSGFVASTVITVAVSITLVALFRRNDWI